MRVLILAAILGSTAGATPASPLHAAAPGRGPDDSIPRVTLADALRRATRLDPDYVKALGQIDNARWGRRAALAVFFTPTLSAGLDATRFSTAFFNIGTGGLQSTSVTARVTAGYDLFNARKLTDLGRTLAELDKAEAGEVAQRFATALLVESDYYDVLAGQELRRVAAERVRRAGDALAVARAKVAGGAVVQTDSLQLVVELNSARVDLLQQESSLRVARLELGRRIGARDAVDAAPLDTLLPAQLPLGLEEAVTAALSQGPRYQTALAAERAATLSLRGRRGEYLPQLTLGGSHQRFDSQIFPSARAVSSLTLSLTVPIWSQGQRELALSQARVERDVAQAQREDLERATRRDVTQAYDAFTTARATVDFAAVGLAAARENFRVQELRYRSGETTILELLTAQGKLTQAEADLVQARYTTRRAQAALEAILGRRLSTNKDAQ